MVAAQDLDVVVATGEFADAFGPHRAALGSRLITAPDGLTACASLTQTLRGDELVLLKGSRGVALERMLPHFEQRWGSFHPHGEAFGPRASGMSTGLRDGAQSAGHPQQSNSGVEPESRGE
jgi:hypothetical protein